MYVHMNVALLQLCPTQSRKTFNALYVGKIPEIAQALNDYLGALISLTTISRFRYAELGEIVPLAISV